MRPIKLLLLFVFLNIYAPKVSAQVYRFKTSSVSISEKDAKGKWGEWTDFKKSEIAIKLDGDKDRIVVNTQEQQLYRIAAYMKKVSTPTEDTLGFECVDNDGASCIILIVTRKKENNRMQFYINYPDLRLVYNIYNTK
ncbi:hypothetical protein OX284_001745 [Flavobacterium sp. SUN046]|uniref:hypothetical protein n=1 Tax=Flavobacterium sp. SUN046 TaxID=3002440 RepID=UPI002DB65E88|nr:hypothetical protein [Flavobacterium sp. SUN046]MEC4048138.1 hypothetical protein [Flavobacterium sp. SUN046]